MLLLDIGPTADGRIPLIMVDRLLAIGDWLEINGEAIKDASKSFKSLPWGRATTKGDTLYLHIFDWPEDDRLVVPGLLNGIESATMLGDRLARRPGAGDRADRRRHRRDRPGQDHPFEHATVIQLELDGPPMVDESIRTDAGGVLRLDPGAATLAGPSIRVESYPGADGNPVSNMSDTGARGLGGMVGPGR